MSLPFTPRFVDLVRTFTTTEGTGPIVPGQPVQGFSSFADTLTAGEQFYYCVQSVSRPEEREVGRGTLAGDGSIMREALDGVLTDFGEGAKTISLVAAAEWFEQQQQQRGGASQGGQVEIVVEHRSALAQRPTGSAALLCERGREGLFLFEEGDHSRLVAADSRQGIYVASAADPSGSSGAWVRRFDGPINLHWFGAAANFVTDDRPAMLAALNTIAARGSGGARGGDRLHIPAGRYYFSTAVDVHCPVHISGAGSGQNSNAVTTVIRFGKTCNGFVFNHDNTHGDSVGSQGAASASTLEGMSLWGGGVDVDAAGNASSFAAGNSTSGHGVRIRTTFVRLVDIYVGFFGGDGFHINCTAGSGGSAEGNANSFYLAQCQAQYNRGSGFLMAGNDANAGTVNTCSAIENGGCGFKDYSFLGNSYIQCHARDNGVRDPTLSDGPTGTCRYGSDYYYAVAGQEAAASTTVPGTNAAVWRKFGGHPSCKTWRTGLTWVVGAPYATNPANVNARNLFSGCYAEGSQGPVQATYPSLIIGGMLDEVGVDGTAPSLRGGRDTLVGPSFQAAAGSGEGRFSTLGEGGQGRVMAGHHDGKHWWRWKSRSDGMFLLDVGNSETPLVGVAPAFGGWSFPALLRTPVISSADGDVANGRLHATIGAVSDLNGKSLTQGEVFYLRSPNAAGPFGYFCTTAGTGGSSAVLTPFGPGGGGGGLSDGDKGDVSVGGGGASLTVESATPSSGIFPVSGHVRASQSFYFQTAGTIGQLREVGGSEVELVAANGSGSAPAVLNIAGSTIRFRNGGGGPILAEFSGASGFVVPNNIISVGGAIGYGEGIGGAVVQGLGKSTAVTLNKVSGQITTHGGAMPAGSATSFTLTNDKILADDEVSVWIKGGAAADAYAVSVTAVENGRCRVQLRNFSPQQLSEAVVLGFAVRRGAIR